MRCFLEITPRDPFTARDGRPFGTGNRMKGLDWPYPSVIAGSLRTMLGKRKGQFVPEELKAVEVAGMLLVRDGVLFFPAPKDCVLCANPPASYAAKPREAWSGHSNLPDGLWPVALPDEAGDDFKPDRLPSFVGLSLMEQWLLGHAWTYPFPEGSPVLAKIDSDERTHVSIEAIRGAAEDAKLFSTSGIALPEGTTLQVRAGQSGHVTGMHPLGGERRLARWQIAQQPAKGWICPKSIADALATLDGASAKRIRLVLATPGLFSEGWQPGWLMRGETVPGTQVTLKLRGACVDRARPISGWSLEDGRRGPKPARRLAPAGSVYFCEVTGGNPSELARAWLEPVCDAEQDRKDGFGLALWGLWV